MKEKLRLRLSKWEIETIKAVAKEVFGECRVFIFGSRVRDKKGGDIDIFVIPKDKTNLFKKEIKMASKLENLLGKPVDIVVSRNLDREIEKEAIKGVEI